MVFGMELIPLPVSFFLKTLTFFILSMHVFKFSVPSPNPLLTDSVLASWTILFVENQELSVSILT